MVKKENMGKGLELLSMIGIQLFLAAVVAMTLMTQYKGKNKDASDEILTSLTSKRVEHFIQEFTAITTGRSKTLDVYGVTEYLMKHLSRDGEYITTISFETHDAKTQEERLVMDRLKYISNVLQAMKGVTAHEVTVQIENIEIAENGKQANVVVNSLEKGLVPIPDESGESQFMAMAMMSYCEQQFVLTDDHIIQLVATDCTTNISFLE